MKNVEARCMLTAIAHNCKVPPMLMGLFGHCLLPHAVHPNIFRVLREVS